MKEVVTANRIQMVIGLKESIGNEYSGILLYIVSTLFVLFVHLREYRRGNNNRYQYTAKRITNNAIIAKQTTQVERYYKFLPLYDFAFPSFNFNFLLQRIPEG
uniref:Uncharacterized protein n=1 Tax=Glossina palpalis gambiensis TaxID=67801 RepID=A0A1B0AS28_9MUSC